MEPHAGGLINKAIQLAKEGDINALRLCIERLIPKPKEEPIQFTLPKGDLRSCNTLLNLGVQVIEALARGELTLEQARQVNDIIDAQAKTIERSELIERIAAIEDSLGIKHKKH